MKEESKFGFKDKAKAEETLKLLEEHDPGYRRLTVRGLLGRAKRVLSLTKAEDKIKNIKEAMEVFETWLADLDKNKDNDKEKNKDKSKDNEKKTEKRKREEKKSSSDEEAGPSESNELPPEGVQGLGFKDPAAARATLEALEGRDPDYQLLAVKGLLGRARRVLTLTKDETKLADIKAAMEILEQFTRDYDSSGMAARIYSWLPIGFVRTAHQLAADSVTEQQRSFLSAYESMCGEHKRLRNVASESGVTWDRVRNTELKALKEKHANAYMFDGYEKPTKEHLEMLVWAYSPDANRLKRAIKETKEEVTPEKMDHDGDEDDEDTKKRDSEKKKDSDEKKKDKDDKRRDSDEKMKDKDDKRRDSDEKKKDKDDKRRESDEKKKDHDDKRRDSRDKRKDDERSERKRKSSAKSDDESHSKKRRE